MSTNLILELAREVIDQLAATRKHDIIALFRKVQNISKSKHRDMPY